MFFHRNLISCLSQHSMAITFREPNVKVIFSEKISHSDDVGVFFLPRKFYRKESNKMPHTFQLL